MPAALRSVVPLLVLLSAVSAHPVVDLRCVVAIDGERIEIEITGSWEDVVSLGGVVPDIGPAYGLGALQRADAVFRDRLVQGLVLSGAASRRLALRALPPAGVPLGPGEALSADDLTALPWTVHLQGQRPEDPVAVQAQIDVGARRSRIAFSLAVRVVVDGRELPERLWAEGLPYLLCDERPQDPALLAEPHPALRTGFAWLQPAARGLRVEVLVPWLLIAEELGIQREDPALITPVDRARLAAAAAVEPWLEVDCIGQALTLQLVELRQFGLDGEDADPTEVLPLATTRIGLVLEARWQQRPAAVTLSWRLFGRILDSLELAVMDRPEEDARVTAPGQAVILALPAATAPVLSPLVAVAPPREARLPLLAILGASALFLAVLARRWLLAVLGFAVTVTALLGGFGVWRLPQERSLPSEAPAVVLRPLLERIYAAVAAGDDAALYDRLATATTGAALTTTFRDLAGALRDRDQGGAWVSIDDVHIEQADLAVDGATLAGTCSWQVASRVLHWGHVHHRASRVEARLRLAAVDGSWVLSELQITDRGRVRVAP